MIPQDEALTLQEREQEIIDFLKTHEYKKIANPMLSKQLQKFRFKKESIVRGAPFSWFYKKTTTGYTINIIIADEYELQEIKKSYLRVVVISGESIKKTKEFDRNKVSSKILEELELVFTEIPTCPNCGKTMKYRNDQSYWCINFRKHSPEKMLKIAIPSGKVSYAVLQKHKNFQKRCIQYEKRISVC